MAIWIPIVSILVTGAVSWLGLLVNRWLGKRDLRAHIQADQELYKELGDEFERSKLKASIDARIEELAVQSIPLHGKARRQLTVMRLQVLLGLQIVVLGFLMSSSWVQNSRGEEHKGDYQQIEEMIRTVSTPWLGYLIGMGGGVVLAKALRKRTDLPNNLRHESLNARMQNGPGSAGTPPNPADTA